MTCWKLSHPFTNFGDCEKSPFHHFHLPSPIHRCEGPGICHGIAGNGYSFLSLYRVTEETFWEIGEIGSIFFERRGESFILAHFGLKEQGLLF